MCLNKQDSEYASGPKYAKILNIAKFLICQGAQYASVTQDSECARIFLNISEYISCSKYANILNIAAF